MADGVGSGEGLAKLSMGGMERSDDGGVKKKETPKVDLKDLDEPFENQGKATEDEELKPKSTEIDQDGPKPNEVFPFNEEANPFTDEFEPGVDISDDGRVGRWTVVTFDKLLAEVDGSGWGKTLHEKMKEFGEKNWRSGFKPDGGLRWRGEFFGELSLEKRTSLVDLLRKNELIEYARMSKKQLEFTERISEALGTENIKPGFGGVVGKKIAKMRHFFEDQAEYQAQLVDRGLELMGLKPKNEEVEEGKESEEQPKG